MKNKIKGCNYKFLVLFFFLVGDFDLIIKVFLEFNLLKNVWNGIKIGKGMCMI